MNNNVNYYGFWNPRGTTNSEYGKFNYFQNLQKTHGSQTAYNFAQGNGNNSNHGAAPWGYQSNNQSNNSLPWNHHPTCPNHGQGQGNWNTGQGQGDQNFTVHVGHEAAAAALGGEANFQAQFGDMNQKSNVSQTGVMSTLGSNQEQQYNDEGQQFQQQSMYDTQSAYPKALQTNVQPGNVYQSGSSTSLGGDNESRTRTQQYAQQQMNQQHALQQEQMQMQQNYAQLDPNQQHYAQLQQQKQSNIYPQASQTSMQSQPRVTYQSGQHQGPMQSSVQWQGQGDAQNVQKNPLNLLGLPSQTTVVPRVSETQTSAPDSRQEMIQPEVQVPSTSSESGQALLVDGDDQYAGSNAQEPTEQSVPSQPPQFPQTEEVTPETKPRQVVWRGLPTDGKNPVKYGRHIGPSYSNASRQKPMISSQMQMQTPSQISMQKMQKPTASQMSMKKMQRQTSSQTSMKQRPSMNQIQNKMSQMKMSPQAQHAGDYGQQQRQVQQQPMQMPAEMNMTMGPSDINVQKGSNAQPKLNPRRSNPIPKPTLCGKCSKCKTYLPPEIGPSVMTFPTNNSALKGRRALNRSMHNMGQQDAKNFRAIRFSSD